MMGDASGENYDKLNHKSSRSRKGNSAVSRFSEDRICASLFRAARSSLRRPPHKRNLPPRLRQNNPTGKSLLIFRNYVKPRNQKYSASPDGQISDMNLPVSPDERGGSRSSRTRGGMRWTQCLRRRTQAARTAKSCGPDAHMLASSSREANASRGRRWQKSLGSPGRARSKP